MIWRSHQTKGPSEATRSRVRAEKKLEETRARTPKYVALAQSLKELREANNFAAAIETSFRGGKR